MKYFQIFDRVFLLKLLDDIIKRKNIILIAGELFVLVLTIIGLIGSYIPKNLNWLATPLIVIICGIVIYSICQIIIKSKKNSTIGVGFTINKYEPAEIKFAKVARNVVIVCVLSYLLFWGLSKAFWSSLPPKSLTTVETGIVVSKFHPTNAIDEFSNSLVLDLLEKLNKNGLDSIGVKQDRSFILPVNVDVDTLEKKFEINKTKKGIFACGEFYDNTKSLNCKLFIYQLPIYIRIETELKLPETVVLKTPDTVRAQLQADYVGKFILAILLQRLSRFEESNLILDELINKDLDIDLNETMLLLSGNNFAAQKKYDKAIELFSRILVTNPTNNIAKYNLSLTLLGKQNYSASMSVLIGLNDKESIYLREIIRNKTINSENLPTGVSNNDRISSSTDSVNKSDYLNKLASEQVQPPRVNNNDNLKFLISNGWIQLDTGLIAIRHVPGEIKYEAANYLKLKPNSTGISFSGKRYTGGLLIKSNLFIDNFVDTVKLYLYSGLELRSFAEILLKQPPTGEQNIDIPLSKLIASTYCDSVIFQKGVIPEKILVFGVIDYRVEKKYPQQNIYFFLE